MTKRLTSKDVIPHGGFYFVEDGIVLKKGSFAELEKLVIEHRQANAKPIGNPSEDIQDQICSRWPAGCRTRKTLMSMAIKFGMVLERMMMKREGLVDQAEADRRSAICTTCPQNIPAQEARAGGCKKCERAADAIINRFRKVLLQNRAAQHASSLKSCGICGCDNQLQVWIPMTALAGTVTDKAALPESCSKR